MLTQLPAVKTCSKCKRTFPVESYHRHEQRRDGTYTRKPKCAECTAQERRESPRYRACDKVANMVDAGELPPVHERNCYHCGGKAEHHHHPFIDRPRLVIPLCRKCHAAEHKRIKLQS